MMAQSVVAVAVGRALLAGGIIIMMVLWIAVVATFYFRRSDDP